MSAQKNHFFTTVTLLTSAFKGKALSRLCLTVSVAMGLSACSQVTGEVQEPTELYAELYKDSAASENKTVTVLGLLPEESVESFEKSLAPFEEKTGIDVVFESAPNFNSLLRMRIASFYEPDIAILPQPGIMLDLVENGHLVPLTDFIDIHRLREAYPEAWLELGSVEGVPYGLWYRASAKSLVWYNPSAFERKGYDIPRSWDELIALSDRIVADGGTPWCIGLESGEASGWPGTDWVEDILLRTGGPEAYNQWITHQMPFNSPSVIKAFNEFGKFLKTPKYTKGGPQTAVSTAFTDSVLGIFGESPDCYMHRQANFISASFPEEAQPKVDYDVFLLPGIDPKYGTPLLVAGDALVMFNQTPESEALMRYLITPEPHEIWAGEGGFISAHKDVSLEAYSDVVTQNIAQMLADADVVRFDGSDVMPGYIGTDLFWSGIIDFAEGQSAEEVTKSIENSWP